MSLLSSSTFIQPIATPCIGVCSTGLGDEVCRGCKRFAYEVIHWNGFNAGQRLHVYQRLESLLESVLANYLGVVDSVRLRHKLAEHQIDDPDYLGDNLRVMRLLQAGAKQIIVPADFGLKVWNKQLSLAEIRLRVDQEFFTVSKAHFERYFRVGLGENGTSP